MKNPDQIEKMDTPPQNSLDGIKNYNKKVLNQLLNLLDKIDNSDYSVTIPLLYESTIGKHCRHILEFYQCFLKSDLVGELNYDLRERNMRLETDVLFAKELIDEICIALMDKNHDFELEISSELPEGKGFHKAQTTIGRELGYLADHTVHHLAIVKIGLALIRPEVGIEPTFGIAASTINNQKRQ